MARHASPSARFVISAWQGQCHVEQSRLNVASAIVLARKWRESGLTGVTVLAPSGEEITPESFAASRLAKTKLGR